MSYFDGGIVVHRNDETEKSPRNTFQTCAVKTVDILPEVLSLDDLKDCFGRNGMFEVELFETLAD